MPANPFEAERAEFLVLRNDRQEYSLWPAFAAVPAGWEIVYGRRDRKDCLDYIEAAWIEPLPR